MFTGFINYLFIECKVKNFIVIYWLFHAKNMFKLLVKHLC